MIWKYCCKLLQDFWGYTPLHLLMACSEGPAPPPDDPVQRKLVQVLLRLLQLGASTTQLTVAGERASDLGPDVAKSALKLAQRVLDGSATLEISEASSLESAASLLLDPTPAVIPAADEGAVASGDLQEQLSGDVHADGIAVDTLAAEVDIGDTVACAASAIPSADQGSQNGDTDRIGHSAAESDSASRGETCANENDASAAGSQDEACVDQVSSDAAVGADLNERQQSAGDAALGGGDGPGAETDLE